MTCPTNTCVASQGDCLTTATDYKYCPQNEYTNSSYAGTSVCNCRTIAQWPVVGTTCSSGSSQTNQCGPRATCAVATGGLAADYKCYGKKMIGDSCTVGGYECAAPRVCVSGVCQANLAAGATCWNATSVKSLGMCPMTQYCPAVYTSNQVCTALATAGSTCDSVIKCVPFTECGLYSSSSPKCDRPLFGAVADGGDMPNLGPAGCVSYLINSTSLKCVNYDTELAKWNAAFPTPAAIACTTSADCNLPGVTLARCACTAKATGSTPYCLLGVKPSIASAADVAVAKQGGIIETAYENTCENPTPNGFEFVNDATYCSNKWSSALLAAACPSFLASASAGFSCYDGTLGLCNGASALQSSVVMTMIVALVAFFTTQ